jgi:hypothetical protein
MTEKTIDEKKREFYVGHVNSGLEGAKRKIAKFAADVVENPEHAMTWSDDTFTTAAKHTMYTRIAQGLGREECTLQMVYDTLQSEFLSKARYINNRSTSTGSNRMADCTVSVLAEELEFLGRGFLG